MTRKEAINTLANFKVYISGGGVTDKKANEALDLAIATLVHLPSADRPTGEWIHNPNGTDRDFVWWKCSNCGQIIFSESERDRKEFHAFCGRCGAQMKGADDECL